MRNYVLLSIVALVSLIATKAMSFDSTWCAQVKCAGLDQQSEEWSTCMDECCSQALREYKESGFIGPKTEQRMRNAIAKGNFKELKRLELRNGLPRLF